MKKIKEFNKIVLAVDGSDISKKAAKKAFFLSKLTGINIVAIHVIYVPYTPVTAYVRDISGSLEKHGKEILNEIEKTGYDMGIIVKTKLLNGIPDDEIIKFANKNDLIIMGCKGHSAIGRILIGSISEKVLHHSKSTVMIVR